MNYEGMLSIYGQVLFTFHDMAGGARTVVARNPVAMTKDFRRNHLILSVDGVRTTLITLAFEGSAGDA